MEKPSERKPLHFSLADDENMEDGHEIESERPKGEDMTKCEPALGPKLSAPVQMNSARHDRIKTIQQQLEALADSEIKAVVHELATVASHAQEIADGGDAYHSALRDDMRRLADHVRQFIARTERLMNR